MVAKINSHVPGATNTASNCCWALLVCSWLILATNLISASDNEPSRAGFVSFLQIERVEAVLGEKLSLSNSKYAQIHASGDGMDYFPYTYDSAKTPDRIRISYLTRTLPGQAARDFDGFPNSGAPGHFAVAGSAAKFFPKRKQRPEDFDANLFVVHRNEIIGVQANHIEANQAGLQKLSRIARVALSPKLQGRI